MYRGIELLPITRDVVFKAVFTDPENKPVLFSLLQGFLDITAASPEDIEIVSGEKHRQFYDDKLFRLDLRVKTTSNEHIDVEVQIQDKKDIVKRSIYYTASLFAEQMKKGLKYSKLGRTVALNILCYTIPEGENKPYITSYTLHDKESLEELTDAFELVFVELPKAPQLNGLRDLQEQWTAFFTAQDEETLDRLCETNSLFEKAVDKMVYVSLEERQRYDRDMERKAEFDAAAEEQYRLEALEDAEAKGDRERQIESARRLIMEHADNIFISKITDLTEAEIEALRAEM